MTIAARIAHARKKESEEAHTIASTYSRLQLDSCRTRRFQRSNNARKTKKPIAEIAERKATAESPTSTNTSRRAARRHNWTFNRNYNTHIYIYILALRNSRLRAITRRAYSGSPNTRLRASISIWRTKLYNGPCRIYDVNFGGLFLRSDSIASITRSR